MVQLGAPRRRTFPTPAPHRPAGGTVAVAIAVLVLLGGSVGALPRATAEPPIHATAGGTANPLAVPPTLPSPPARGGHPLASDPLGAWSPPFGTIPAAWGGADHPPGAEVLDGLRGPGPGGSPAAAVPAAAGAGWGSNTSDPLGQCFGIWPDQGGQSTYADNCYGHDEPGIQFYSTLPGSGGNTTWNITLPRARSISDPQLDLYTAIWFGATFTDPYAWLHECFLELQFYPDSSWSSSSIVPGNWVGAAVAWQIESLTGYEDACFYNVLYQDGTNDSIPLDMTSGDQIAVTMAGGVGTSAPEQLTIADLTSGLSSTLAMYDNYGLPLVPSSSTNSQPNALQWTPGGELPMVFAFETGHPPPPYPENNSYGGCSAGPPPSTAQDPAVPCPSYDPGSWANDTLTPWEIPVPTFFNATATERPTQVTFSQDLGGLAFIDPISNGTCDGREWTAWCTYPWYSYSCAQQAFEFGAIDYATTSADFGKALEFDQNYTLNDLELGFYPPENFSVPTCGGPAYSVGLTGGGSAGSVYFLSHAYAGSTVVPSLGPGEYSIGAIPSPGKSFVGWTTTGGVSVDGPADPQTTLWVAGNGNVTAVFSTGSVATGHFTFDDSVSSATIAVYPVYLETTGRPIATLAAGATLDLAPGLYGLEAYPPPDYYFRAWSVSGAGADVVAPAYPFTWLEVSEANSSVTITQTDVATTDTASLYYGSFGGGNVSFNGGPASGYTNTTVRVGTYPVVATPDAGYSFEDWYLYSPGIMADFEATSNVTLERTTAKTPMYLFAEFAPTPAVVDIAVTPGGAGAFSLDGGPPQPAGAVVVAPGPHTLVGLPAAGYSLSGYATTDPAAIDLVPLATGGEELLVNGSGNVTIGFATAPAENLSFATQPATGGTIEFAFAPYADGSQNTTVTNGTYPLAAIPAPGYNFTGWTVTGPVATLSGGFAVVSGPGGTLTAVFAPARYLVTFVADAPYGIASTVGDTTLATDDSAWFTSGSYALATPFPSGTSFLGWAPTAGLTPSGGPNSSVEILASGTLEMLVRGFEVTAFVGSPATIDRGQSASFDAAVYGPDGTVYSWDGLPAGCASAALAFSCMPNATGTFNISFTAVSPDGVSVSVRAGTLVVVPALALTGFSASVSDFTVGGTTEFTVGYAGGIAPYAIEYSGLPIGCLSANASTLACTPLEGGTSDVTVSITDAAGFPVFRTIEVTVNPVPLVPTVAIDHAVVDAGVPVTVTATATGGTAPETVAYAGLPQGCAPSPTLVLACTPMEAGDYTIVVTVTDADGFSGNGSVGLVVLPAPTVALGLGPSTVLENGTVELFANVSGGSAPYSYQFTGLPPGCLGRNASTLACVPRGSGTFTVSVNVTDAFGLHAVGTAVLTVKPSGSGPVTPSNPGPTGPSTAVLVGVALALVLLAIVVALVLARRRGPRRIVPSGPDEPEPAPEAEEDEADEVGPDGPAADDEPLPDERTGR